MRQYRGIVKGVDTPKKRWAYGWYFEIEGKHFILPDDAYWGRYANGGVFGFIEVIPETVGQSTGLKDKNGEEKKDVYANDKIIITDGDFEAIGIVKMNDKTGQWVWMATEVEASAPTVYKGREIPLWEVLDKQHRWNGCLISHIHQNPELLENK